MNHDSTTTVTGMGVGSAFGGGGTARAGVMFAMMYDSSTRNLRLFF